jgi:hypothetical protein
MLTIEQLSGHFPLALRQRNPRGMLVEYLQYELLDSLFKNPAAAALSFIGGTAIRILHNSHRFSEDLDFDNFGLSFAQFEELLKTACRDMEYKGFLIEYRIVEKGAYHCYIRFPEILHQSASSIGSDPGCRTEDPDPHRQRGEGKTLRAGESFLEQIYHLPADPGGAGRDTPGPKDDGRSVSKAGKRARYLRCFLPDGFRRFRFCLH